MTKPFSDSLSFGMVAAIDTGLEDDVIIMSAGKFRLWIKCIHMAWPTFHEQHDDPFCSRRKHRWLECKRRTPAVIGLEKIAESDRPKPGTET